MRTTLARYALVLIVATAGVGGQSKAPVPASDYGKFELLVRQPRGGLSPDGRSHAYGINRSNSNNELRIVGVADGASKTISFGSQATFSADSRWVAYAIGYSESQEEKLRQQKKPIQRKLGMLNLASGEMITIDAVETFAFNASGSHLAMKRYAPERKDQPEPSPSADEAPSPTTLIVRQLATGRDTTFGNVTEFAWQEKGTLLAVAINSDDKTGSGVQLVDPESASLRVLDSAAAVYTGLTWRKDADDLAVLRAKTDDRREGSTNVVLAWRGLGSSTPVSSTYDQASASDFPVGLRIVSYRRPSWSHDGRKVFVGLAQWEEKPAGAGATDPEKEPEEPATVDVWHARDIDVIPRQKINARNDRQNSTLAVWHLDNNRLVRLGTDLFERVTPINRQNLAYAVNWSSYAMDRSIGRPAADLYLIDLETGTRTKLKERIDDAYIQASPGGRYLLYLQDDQYWAIDTATRAVTNLSKDLATSFVDRESDWTIKQKPAFGVAGWTNNDEAVILNDKFDLWRIDASGTGAVRMTDGATTQVRHRYVRLDLDEEWIDSSKPIYASLFGIWTKRSGYGRIDPGQPDVRHLILADKSVGGVAKAEKADVFAYTVQAFDDPPQVMVGGPNLSDAKTVAKTNTFAADYAWGRGALVEYKSERGERLQGALLYPAGYQPGKKYPMVVYMYERLSDGLHRWNSPSDRSPYNPAVFTSLGYVVLQPDIAFRPREPGLSVIECVVPAVKKVIAMGVADPARVGMVGHSWGGFDTVYLATHTDVFAAAVAGAPITDLISNYGNHHWRSGIAETDHIETGQQRMEVPLWEDFQAYVRNSAVFGVHKMKTPLLVAFGDNDGTVHWHQGVELYNIARRAKKDVVMLVYGGEDHGLQKKPNQLDYHRRIVQWFGHYLKNEAAPAWITKGVPHLEREAEIKRLKAQQKKQGS